MRYRYVRAAVIGVGLPCYVASVICGLIVYIVAVVASEIFGVEPQAARLMAMMTTPFTFVLSEVTTGVAFLIDRIKHRRHQRQGSTV